jgi:DNA sulfur modification protein DndD
VNFRQYYGDQSLRFAPDGERNVTVINGNNGAGKTSLMLALNWCLYGEKAFDGQVGEITNKRALYEAGAGTEVETLVQLRFRHKGTRYIATRILTQQKIDIDHWRAIGKSELSLMRIRAGGAADELGNPDAQIETMLPSNVRSYFLFDGEKIDRFASPGHEQEVMQAIRNVLQIEALERAKSHLEFVAKEYQRDLKAISSGKLAELLAEEESKRSQADSAKERIANYQEEDRAAKRLLEELDARLADVRAVQELTQQRKLLEELRKSKESEQDQIQLSLRELVTRGYIALAGTVCEQAATALETKRRRGEIPSGFREQFVKDLLEQCRCICGSPLHKGTPEYDHLQDLLTRAIPTQLEDLVLQTASDLRVLQRRGQEIPLQLWDRIAVRDKVERELEKVHDQLEAVGLKLQGSPLEVVAQLEQKRAEVKERKERLGFEMGRLKGKIEALQDDLQGLADSIERERHQEAKAAALHDKFTLARKAADAIEGIVPLPPVLGR